MGACHSISKNSNKADNNFMKKCNSEIQTRNK